MAQKYESLYKLFLTDKLILHIPNKSFLQGLKNKSGLSKEFLTIGGDIYILLENFKDVT